MTMFNLNMFMAFMIGLASFGNPPDRTAYNIHEITMGAKASNALLATRTPVGFMITKEYTIDEASEVGEKGLVVASKKVESKVAETTTVAPSSEPLKFDFIEAGDEAQPNGRTTVDLADLCKNMKDIPLSKEGMHVLRLAGQDGKDVEICVARFENMVVIQQKGAMTAYCIQPAANKPLEAIR